MTVHLKEPRPSRHDMPQMASYSLIEYETWRAPLDQQQMRQHASADVKPEGPVVVLTPDQRSYGGFGCNLRWENGPCIRLVIADFAKDTRPMLALYSPVSTSQIYVEPVDIGGDHFPMNFRWEEQQVSKIFQDLAISG